MSGESMRRDIRRLEEAVAELSEREHFHGLPTQPASRQLPIRDGSLERVVRRVQARRKRGH